MNKKFFIKTYGCQMNFYDSDRLKTLLLQQNFIEVKNAEKADYVIINTCCVRQHAENRAISFLSSLKSIKNKKVFCFVGCIPSLYKDEILKKYDFIDVISGPNSYEKFVSILKSYNGEKISVFEEDKNFFKQPLIPVIENKLSSFVSITKGCENFCSYCVVPYTRGKLVSKPSSIIIEEVKKLVEKGIKEIFLIGQNVNEYGKDIGENFVDLLYKINEIEGILKIGFLTSHPKDVPDELIDCFVNIPKLYKHLHLPLQSGSNKILKLMNRKYTVEKYLEIIEKVRQKVDRISITSDIIVGFPYEEESDFKETYDLIKKIEFDDLFVFKYSPRPKTKASEFPDTVLNKEKEKRHLLILNLQNKISLIKNEKLESCIVEVFVKERSFKKENTYIGRTETNKPVLINCKNNLTGKILKVKILKGERHYLIGEIL